MRQSEGQIRIPLIPRAKGHTSQETVILLSSIWHIGWSLHVCPWCMPQMQLCKVSTGRHIAHFPLTCRYMSAWMASLVPDTPASQRTLPAGRLSDPTNRPAPKNSRSIVEVKAHCYKGSWEILQALLSFSKACLHSHGHSLAQWRWTMYILCWLHYWMVSHMWVLTSLLNIFYLTWTDKNKNELWD